MKYPVFALFGIAAVVLVVGGCFSPNIRNGGFACTGTQDGQCPAGYACVNGLCINNPGSVIPNPRRDMAMPTMTQDMSMSMATQDMAHATMTQDMSMAPIADLAMPPPPPDMSKTNTCAHNYCQSGKALNKTCDPCVNSVCSNDSYCCKVQWDSICVDQVTIYCDNSQQCP